MDNFQGADGMNSSYMRAAAAAVALIATPSIASASTVISQKCVSVSSSSGCLFEGDITSDPDAMNAKSYINAQNAYNAFLHAMGSGTPDIALSFLFDTRTTPGLFTGKAFGSWSTPGFLVDYVAVGAGPNFVLYKIAPTSSGSWSTMDIPYESNPREASHLVFFGTESGAVPEPASWAMMIAGAGIAGAALRRRRSEKMRSACA
ncbi:PEPxxWA-CTERM sorting domain-containing protein [Sphingomonas sp. NFR04]|uniref:PEPxxWA-CTERM sorting domain-containing protein n=1 Tax=Sphingomonas sp. NFR04 TaxID=1566283 RepID=UPI0020C87F6E|nr:PEPxxWA-CTERM sorting domain-containing protein [Sphingomonas sp. NFR04]